MNLRELIYFREVVAEMDNNTILFVIGDHGMTGQGNLWLLFKFNNCFIHKCHVKLLFDIFG